MERKATRTIISKSQSLNSSNLYISSGKNKQWKKFRMILRETLPRKSKLYGSRKEALDVRAKHIKKTKTFKAPKGTISKLGYTKIYRTLRGKYFYYYTYNYPLNSWGKKNLRR